MSGAEMATWVPLLVACKPHTDGEQEGTAVRPHVELGQKGRCDQEEADQEG